MVKKEYLNKRNYYWIKYEPIWRLQIRRSIFLLLFAGICLSVSGQELIPFKAKFLAENDNFEGTLGGRIEGEGSFVVDSNGEISLEIAPKNEVKLSLLGNVWEIVYPENGIVPVPNNPNTFAPVVIGKKGEKSHSQELVQKIQKLETYVRGNEQFVQSELDQLKEDLSSSFGKEIVDALEKQINLYDKIRRENDRRDSLQKVEERRFIVEGRLKTLGILTPAMDHYITRTEDLRDIFKTNGHKAFNQGWVIGVLNERIDAYSSAYEELNKSKNQILDLAEEYWKNDYEKISRTRSLLEYALDEVHKMTTLSSNNLIGDIENYRDPRVRRRNKRKKKEINSDIKRFVYDLNNRLSTLINRKSEVFQLLNEE